MYINKIDYRPITSVKKVMDDITRLDKAWLFNKQLFAIDQLLINTHTLPL